MKSQTPPGPAGPFTRRLWEENRKTVDAIADTPFYRAMAEGTLPREIFIDYLEQDALYLNEDNRALRLTAASCSDPREKEFFDKLASEGIALEKELHELLRKEFSSDGNERIKMNPACRNYSDHLIRTAETGNCRESAAALLPCYWVYQSAGLRVRERSVRPNPYANWIDTYAGEEFTAYTSDFISIVETMAAVSDKEICRKMAFLFKTSTRKELDFIRYFDFSHQ